MNNLLKDFVSKEPRDFSFKIGRDLASALSGFITGVVFSSIIWITCITILSNFSN